MSTYQTQPWVESFSTREREVLQLISNGLSNREIAQELFLSIETIKWYNKQMFMKLGVKNRTQAANKAAELNLLSPDQDPLPQKKIPLTGNLPAQLTSYVGREKEIDQIKDLLNKHRLVVLTGAGGSGKTRLALKVGEELQTVYRNGVWLVELANIREPSLVLWAIANALKLTERADTALDDILKHFLSQKHILLLIDNLEHLLEAAPMIGELLATAPELSVLATSRERLHIYGEQEYPVSPLKLPGAGTSKNREDFLNVESIALFIKRASAVQPALSLNDEALKDLNQICTRLDGLPLAIELCAPMVKVFPLGVIAERIEKSLDAIPSGPRDLPARQQTLRDTIQWGCDLLEENAQRLFIRLAVFNGGGTLQAVESVCGGGISGDIGNILSALVNKNMVLAQERRDGEIHFSLLETIRQFGSDKLAVSGESEEIANRHARYYMKLAKQGAVGLRGADQIFWMNRFVTMQDNIRAVLEWVFGRGEVELALPFVCDLHEFWLRNSDFEEGSRWMGRALALPDAQRYKENYSTIFNNLTWFYQLRGETTEAIKMAEQALPLARSQSNKFNLIEALLNLGLLLLFQTNDFDRVEKYQEEAKNICLELHDEWEQARLFMHLAVTRVQKKEYDTALSLYYESFNLYKKLGDMLFQGVVKRLIGNLEIEQNNLTKGVETHREALRIARSVKNNLQIANNIFEIARAEKLRGNLSRALRLYIASKRFYEDTGAWWSGDDAELGEALETARKELSEAEFQSAWEAGQQMTMEEAIELALGNTRVL